MTVRDKFATGDAHRISRRPVGDVTIAGSPNGRVTVGLGNRSLSSTSTNDEVFVKFECDGRLNHVEQ